MNAIKMKTKTFMYQTLECPKINCYNRLHLYKYGRMIILQEF